MVWSEEHCKAKCWCPLWHCKAKCPLWHWKRRNLFERKADTPLLLRPGVKVENDCCVVLFTPDHHFMNTHPDININFNPIDFKEKLTSPPSAQSCSSLLGPLASLPPSLWFNIQLSDGFEAMRTSNPGGSNLMLTSKVPTCYHLYLHHSHLGLLFRPNILEKGV